jgi:hypothetical protein
MDNFLTARYKNEKNMNFVQFDLLTIAKLCDILCRTNNKGVVRQLSTPLFILFLRRTALWKTLQTLSQV